MYPIYGHLKEMKNQLEYQNNIAMEQTGQTTA